MAWFRLMMWYFNRRPLSPSEAGMLRMLLALQTVSLALTLAAAAVSIYAEHPQNASYPIGFGVGCIGVVRYYVWRYIR